MTHFLFIPVFLLWKTLRLSLAIHTMGDVIVFLVVITKYMIGESWHTSCLFSSCEKTFDCHLWSCSTHYGWCHGVSGCHHHGDGWQAVYLKEGQGPISGTLDFFSSHYFIPKPPNFVEKTFMNNHKTVKFMKVFSLESFPLYGILFVLKLSHMRTQLILHVICKYWSPHLL